MNSKTIYNEALPGLSEALLHGSRIVDLLPGPDQLVRRQPKVKITITLNSRSVEFFKKAAKTHHMKYQTMINEVLDLYASRYTADSDRGSLE